VTVTPPLGLASTSTKTRALSAPSDQWLPFSLSLVAGLVDVTTFITLAGLFSAHITGNLAVLAASIVTDRPLDITEALAIPVFILITALATSLRLKSTKSATPAVAVFLIAQLILLVAAGIVAVTSAASTHPHGPAGIATGLLAVSAMAVQNALLHLTVSRAPSTAVMTGNIVVATIAATTLLLRRHDTTAKETWRTHWPLVVGFFIGCALAAAGCDLVQDRAWITPNVAAVVVVTAWMKSHPIHHH
jgi:uncharacterized membrane protein YoaK (UPF0700 family)